MTFEKILETFKEQFEIDKNIEVVKFRRGYQIFVWDERKQAYIPNAELIKTPETLLKKLIEETETYYILKYSEHEAEQYIKKIKKNITQSLSIDLCHIHKSIEK